MNNEPDSLDQQKLEDMYYGIHGHFEWQICTCPPNPPDYNHDNEDDRWDVFRQYEEGLPE